MRIFRAGANIHYPSAPVLRRLFLEGWFLFHVGRHLFRWGRDYDLIVPVFPPSLCMVAIVLMCSGKARRVGIVHDLQGIMARSIDRPARRVIARLVMGLERYALNRCDSLIALSESMSRELVSQFGVSALHCKVCYPFVTLPEAADRTEDRLAPLFKNGVRHVVYSGALGDKQRPEELLRFFHVLCRDIADVQCHIFSSGPVMQRIRMQLDQLPVDGLMLHDLVPDDQLIHLYRHSTVQVIPQASGTSAAAFPSKFPNILAAGVPVFAICDADSELVGVIDEMACGSATSGAPDSEWPGLLVGLMERMALHRPDKGHWQSMEAAGSRFSVQRVIDVLMEGDAHSL